MTSAFARGASKMTRVEGMDHIRTFRASDLTNDDAVGTHS